MRHVETSAESEALVRQWADAINARDREAVVSMAHDDLELHPLQFGISGHYRGRDGAGRWMDDVRENDLGHNVRVERARHLGDGRVVLFGTVIADGAPLSPYALVAVVRDGRIAGMRSYLEDEQALELTGMLDP